MRQSSNSGRHLKIWAGQCYIVAGAIAGYVAERALRT